VHDSKVGWTVGFKQKRATREFSEFGVYKYLFERAAHLVRVNAHTLHVKYYVF